MKKKTLRYMRFIYSIICNQYRVLLSNIPLTCPNSCRLYHLQGPLMETWWWEFPINDRQLGVFIPLYLLICNKIKIAHPRHILRSTRLHVTCACEVWTILNLRFFELPFYNGWALRSWAISLRFNRARYLAAAI